MLDLSQQQDAHIDQRLREDIIIWLASVRPDGRPHMVAVWFLWDGEHVYIFSKPNNQKIRNLRQNTHVTLALDNTHNGAEVILLDGEAELVDDPDVNTTIPAYVAKYQTRIARIGYTPETMAKDYSQAIRITPTKVYE